MIFGFTEKLPPPNISVYGWGALMFFRKFLEKIEKYHKGNPYVKNQRANFKILATLKNCALKALNFVGPCYSN